MDAGSRQRRLVQWAGKYPVKHAHETRFEQRDRLHTFGADLARKPPEPTWVNSHALYMRLCGGICLKSGSHEDVGQVPAHLRNSLDELRAFAGAGGQTKRFSSPPPPTPREPTFVSLAPLNCNRLWLPGGSEHHAFHRHVGCKLGMSMLCVFK